jgi:hypothetical protein
MDWEPYPGSLPDSPPLVEASADEAMDWEPVPGLAEALEAKPLGIESIGAFLIIYHLLSFIVVKLMN